VEQMYVERKAISHFARKENNSSGIEPPTQASKRRSDNRIPGLEPVREKKKRHGQKTSKLSILWLA
jgi:hypothetical protein